MFFHTGVIWEHNEDLVAARGAFEKACADLGISPDAHDNDQHAQLEQIFVSLINAGECDPEVLRAKAVHQLRLPAAGLFHQIV